MCVGRGAEGPENLHTASAKGPQAGRGRCDPLLVSVCSKLGCPSFGIGSLSSVMPRWCSDGGRRSRSSQEEAGVLMGLRLL